MAKGNNDSGKPPEGGADILPFPASKATVGRNPRRSPAHVAGPAGEEDDLERLVLKLAAMGLAPEEIEILYADRLTEEGWDQERVDEAVARGRAWGRAKVLEAQFSAAISGKVSAQTQMLSHLDDIDWEEGGEGSGHEGEEEFSEIHSEIAEKESREEEPD